eukprot:jgi/Ulvmu1/9563/UM053_0052.1
MHQLLRMTLMLSLVKVHRSCSLTGAGQSGSPAMPKWTPCSLLLLALAGLRAAGLKQGHLRQSLHSRRRLLTVEVPHVVDVFFEETTESISSYASKAPSCRYTDWAVRRGADEGKPKTLWQWLGGDLGYTCNFSSESEMDDEATSNDVVLRAKAHVSAPPGKLISCVSYLVNGQYALWARQPDGTYLYLEGTVALPTLVSTGCPQADPVPDVVVDAIASFPVGAAARFVLGYTVETVPAEPTDAVVFLSGTEGAACPHEPVLWQARDSVWPEVLSSHIRFSYTTNNQEIASTEPFAVYFRSRLGLTMFLRFSVAGDPTSQASNLRLLQFSEGNNFFLVTVEVDGSLKADVKRSSARVTSSSSMAVGSGTDEVYAISYSYATDELSIHKYLYSTVIDVTTVIAQDDIDDMEFTSGTIADNAAGALELHIKALAVVNTALDESDLELVLQYASTSTTFCADLSNMANIVVAMGLDGGQGGVCERPTSPLMAMASAASTTIATRQDISASSFVLQQAASTLLSLTQPFSLHLQSGSGWTVSLAALLDWGSSDSDTANGAPMCLFSLYDASSSTVLMSVHVYLSGSSQVLFFCATAGGCATTPALTSSDGRMVLSFRYVATSLTAEIWQAGVMASSFPVSGATDLWVDGLLLGGLPDASGSGFQDLANGLVEYMAVFDRALSPAEISSMAAVNGAVCAQQQRDERVEVLGAAVGPDGGICARVTPTLIEFPLPADQPTFTGGNWVHDGLQAQGLLFDRNYMGHSERGGFTFVLSVRRGVDPNTGDPPAEYKVASFSSQDGQILWELTSRTDGKWNVRLCLSGGCGSMMSDRSWAFLAFDTIALRYRSDTERVELWVDGIIEGCSNDQSLHILLKSVGGIHGAVMLGTIGTEGQWSDPQRPQPGSTFLGDVRYVSVHDSALSDWQMKTLMEAAALSTASCGSLFHVHGAELLSTAPSLTPAATPSLTPTTSPAVTPTTAPSLAPTSTPAADPTVSPASAPALNPTLSATTPPTLPATAAAAPPAPALPAGALPAALLPAAALPAAALSAAALSAAALPAAALPAAALPAAALPAAALPAAALPAAALCPPQPPPPAPPPPPASPPPSPMPPQPSIDVFFSAPPPPALSATTTAPPAPPPPTPEVVNQPPILRLLSASVIIYPNALLPPQVFTHDFETPLDVVVSVDGFPAALPYMRHPSLLPELPYDDSTDLYGPLTVTYTATDPQGLAADPASQLLYFAPAAVLCPGPEIACPGGVCSTDGLCFPAGLSLPSASTTSDITPPPGSDQQPGRALCESDVGWFCSLQATACVGAPQPEPPQPNPTTSLQLTGPAVVKVNQFEPYGSCGAMWLQALQCDRGAVATDPVEGDISRFVDACVPGYKIVDYGLTLCRINTDVPGEYTVEFSIVDSGSSVRVAVSRTVVVVPLANASVTAEAEEVSLELELLPVPDQEGGEGVLVPQGQTYMACTAGMIDRAELCEPGVNVSVSVGSSAAVRVLACPPDACLPLGCTGHEFAQKGIRGCGVTPASSPIGTTFSIDFVAFDPASPGRTVTVTRTVTVVSPCTPVELYCASVSAQLCGGSPCAARQALLDLQKAGEAINSGDALPRMPRVRFAAAVISQLVNVTPVLGMPWPDVSLIATVLCGVPSAVPLRLCPEESPADGCGVIAEVLQGDTVITPEEPLAMHESYAYAADRACSFTSVAAGTCSSCSAGAIADGLCMAGWHELSYRARSRAAGVSNTAVVLVSVLQRLVAADVSVVCALRVPSGDTADLPLDTLLASLNGDSAVTNEVLWGAQQVLQAEMQAAFTGSECSAVRAVTGRYMTPVSCSLQRREGVTSSFLSQNATTGVLTIEIGIPATVFFVINSTDAAAAVRSSAQAAMLACANATLASAAAMRRSMTRVLELLASRGGAVLPANEAFVGVAVAAGVAPRADQCPAPDVEAVAASMLQAALDSAAEFGSEGESAVQAGLELSAPGLQLWEEYARAVTVASTYCSLVDSMLATAEARAAATERIDQAQAAAAAPALLELRLQGIASDACAFSLRELEAAATTALHASPPRAASDDAAAVERNESLLEVSQRLILRQPRPQLLLEGSHVPQDSRRLLAEAEELAAVAGTPETPAGTLARFFAGKNEVITGLLLHQTREPVPGGKHRCHARFSRLDPACHSKAPMPASPPNPASEATTAARQHSAAAYGSDPMFNPRSGLYSPQLQGREASFYNTSAEAQQVSAVAMPYGFFPRPSPGLPAGFPVVFETSQRREPILRLLRVLRDGVFIDSRTEHLMATFATANTAQQATASVTLSIRSLPAGKYSMHALVQAIRPARYAQGVTGGTRLALDLAALASLALWPCLLCRRLFVAICCAWTGSPSGRSQQTSMPGRVTDTLIMPGCSVITACIAALQAAAACTLVATMVLSRGVTRAAAGAHAVYADLTAEARVTLPAKAGGFSSLDADVAGAAQLPGAADVPQCPTGAALAVWSMPVWARPDDDRGLEGLALHLGRLGRALAMHDAYSTLQALTVGLLLLRWLLLLHVLPRASPAAHALLALTGQLLACAAATAAVCVPLAVLLLLLAGDRGAEAHSTLRAMLSLLWEAAVAGSRRQVQRLLYPPGLEVTIFEACVTVAAQLTAGLLLLLLPACAVAAVVAGWRELRKQHRAQQAACGIDHAADMPQYLALRRYSVNAPVCRVLSRMRAAHSDHTAAKLKRSHGLLDADNGDDMHGAGAGRRRSQVHGGGSMPALPVPARSVLYTPRTVTYLLTIAVAVTMHARHHRGVPNAASGDFSREWPHAQARSKWALWLLNRLLRLLGSSARSMLDVTGLARVWSMRRESASGDGVALRAAAAVGEARGEPVVPSANGASARVVVCGSVLDSGRVGGRGTAPGLVNTCTTPPEGIGGTLVQQRFAGGRACGSLPPLQHTAVPIVLQDDVRIQHFKDPHVVKLVHPEQGRSAKVFGSTVKAACERSLTDSLDRRSARSASRLGESASLRALQQLDAMAADTGGSSGRGTSLQRWTQREPSWRLSRRDPGRPQREVAPAQHVQHAEHSQQEGDTLAHGEAAVQDQSRSAIRWRALPECAHVTNSSTSKALRVWEEVRTGTLAQKGGKQSSMFVP